MKRELKVLAIGIILCLVFVTYGTCEEIVIGAGQAPMENILKQVQDSFQRSTKIQLKMSSCGPKAAFELLEKGAVEVALGGLDFDDWLAFMKVEGAEIKNPSAYSHTVVGNDRVLVYVNRENPVTKLSKEQVKGIFTGQIQSWKEVGGTDMPIIIVWTNLLGGNFLFQKNILDGAAPAKDVLAVNTSADAKAAIAANQEAIGIGPVSIYDPGMKSVDAPEVPRPITLITKGKPQPKVQSLIDYVVKGDGQKLVKQ
jgi:phosphate transport system substrate-binding protein